MVWHSIVASLENKAYLRHVQPGHLYSRWALHFRDAQALTTRCLSSSNGLLESERCTRGEMGARVTMVRPDLVIPGCVTSALTDPIPAVNKRTWSTLVRRTLDPNPCWSTDTP